MGAGQSKDEMLYQEVLNGNIRGVKELRRNGASVEWIDKEGRTPLVLACTRGELLDMAATLISLGANIETYRPGSHRGTPLHHAAKRGLEKTVSLLLSHGANPLTINDDGLTPLQMARMRGHVSVVRILEERLCLFSGVLREISGFGILETIAPGLVTKKIWVVVLPTEAQPRRAPKYELAIYQSIKVAQPRTVISLSKAEIEEPKFNIPDPVLYITDKATKTRYKLLAENEGDKNQIELLYRACKGFPQVSLPASSGQAASPSCAVAYEDEAGHPNRQPIVQSMPASSSVVNPANQQDDCNGWDTQDGSYNGWGPPDSSEKRQKETSYGGWEDKGESTYNGWGPDVAPGDQHITTVPDPEPSAPPLPEDRIPDGHINYPSVPTIEDATASSANSGDNKSVGMCVICWDAPSEAACIPCGHMAGCMNCLSEVKSKNWGCPVCREKIQQVVKVYAV